MKRLFIEKLEKWAQNPLRKPLVLSGARQVGKTWLLKELGRVCFKNTAYVNFDQNDALASLFSGRFDLNRILVGLGAESGTVITPGETLIVLDEIQTCPAALTSLKYWQEQANEYHVAAAGSLIGLSLQEGTGYPVGKTNSMTLYPMSFFEFLAATGDSGLCDVVKSGDGELLRVFGPRLTDRLREYFLVGGMPSAVAAFASTHSIDAVREVQNDIISDYQRDFAKHSPKVQLPRIRAIWNALPVQLARQDKRFVAGDVADEDGNRCRARDLRDPFEWLEGAGLVYRIWNVAKPGIPLESYRNHLFKLFGVDVGLLSAQSHIAPRAVLDGNALFSEYKGALAEQFVQQELRTLDGVVPHYWTSPGSRAEVDFVVECANSVVPIEVKAETNLRSKSLKAFRERFKVPMSVRASLAGFDRQDGLVNVPLFAIAQLRRFIEET